ncbi:Mov34/MPN/PAD-1 family protein [Rhodococcus sp. NPDC059968]|uniref:Mov34/MPN/PAD-1 family protein n=1 Tax=Rhodococcus sp. NPDC059968 TaxID=3347017 RepID=UPI00366BF49D
MHHAQTLANQAWKAERAQWIGEWHTHPGGQPVPSPFDMISYVRHLEDPELGFTQFLSLIVAFPGTGAPTLGAWRITKHDAQAVDIQVVAERD